jgi:hypothetical protein
MCPVLCSRKSGEVSVERAVIDVESAPGFDASEMAAQVWTLTPRNWSPDRLYTS